MTATHETSTSTGAVSHPAAADPPTRPERWRAVLVLAVVAGLAAGCASDADDPLADRDPVVDATRGGDAAADPGSVAGEQRHPAVVDAVAEQSPDGTWRFDVTISSPYDSPERYADAWRVLGPDGTELGVRVLTHDHANEQPFTRSLSGVTVPDDIDTVTIEGRDLVNGWGGETLAIDLGA